MPNYAFAVSTPLNNHTITALPSGTGNYGDMYQLTKADGVSTFYAHVVSTDDDDIAPPSRLVFEGFEVNTSHPLPVTIVSGGASGGSIGTTTTPNVSTLADPTTPTHQASIVAPGTTGTYALSVQGVTGGLSFPVTNGGGTSVVTSVAGSTTVATALSALATRRKWIVTNDSAALMYVKIGIGCSATSYTYCLSPKSTTAGGGSCEGSDTSAITVILSSGTGNALVTEVTA